MIKKLSIYASITIVALVASFHASCPKPGPTPGPAPRNPPFFKDIYPDQGPWRVQVMGEQGAYQKLYLHTQAEAMIAATFAFIDEPINIDLTDPNNQKLLAETALQGFCKGIDMKCLVDSSDLAWLVGNPLQYIYVRFRAEKRKLPIMRGLIYYRFDQPIQTMYILLSEERSYDNFETVFLNYLSQVKFIPERFQ